MLFWWYCRCLNISMATPSRWTTRRNNIHSFSSYIVIVKMLIFPGEVLWFLTSLWRHRQGESARANRGSMFDPRVNRGEPQHQLRRMRRSASQKLYLKERELPTVNQWRGRCSVWQVIMSSAVIWSMKSPEGMWEQIQGMQEYITRLASSQMLLHSLNSH